MSPESESGVKLGRRFDAGSVLHRYSPIPPSASDCFTRAAQESEPSNTPPTLSEFIASHSLTMTELFIHLSIVAMDSTMYSYFNRIDTTLPLCLSQEAPHLESCVRISTAIRFTRELFSDRRIKSAFHAKLLWKFESGEGLRKEGGRGERALA